VISAPARPTRVRDPLAWAGVFGVCAAGGALIAFFGRVMGLASPIFAFEAHFIGMACAVYVDKFLVPRLDGRWFEVSPREVRVYRALGSLGFMRLLRAIGWERAMRVGEKFEMKRATLFDYERATRHGENAHALLFVLTLLASVPMALCGAGAGVPWLVGMGVVFHVYPVMLQRTQRARLQPLLARCAVPAGA
jgi:hypothetical protein